MVEPAGPENVQLRAFLHVGGLSVARQQVGLALHLGCERIIALRPVVGPAILQLQQLVEDRGARFHAIANARALSGLVTVADELIVLADGLLPEPRQAIRLLDAGPGIVVQPAESGIAAGFERLDINLASGGAMRIPGRLVERLIELPDDADPFAALTRLALQAGLPQRQLAADGADAPGWMLVRDDAEAHALESAWLAQRVPVQVNSGPSRWLSAQLAKRAGPALLHMPHGTLSLLAAAVALALLGLGAGWLAWPILGLLLCLVGAIVGQTSEILDAVERNALYLPSPRFAVSPPFGWALDLVLLLVAGWGTPLHFGATLAERLFTPAMVILTSRLARRVLKTWWRSWLGDRAVLALLFLIGLVSGQAELLWQAGTVLLAGVTLAWPATARITST
jgi:hypothetical protein